MGRAYATDLRLRAMALVQDGQSCRSVARLLDLGASTVIRWAQRCREQGSPQARPVGGRRPLALLHEQDWPLARMSSGPDFTLRGLRAELAARGTRVRYDAVWRFVRQANATFKKTLRATEQDRPDIARKRELWRRYQGRVGIDRLVLIDET